MAIQPYDLKKTAIITLLILVCLATWTLAGWADDPNPKARGYKSLDATLLKKTHGQVTDSFGVRYVVDKSTMIIGTDGRQVNLIDLNVPCDVSLKIVEQADGDPLAVRIKVREVHPGANFQMDGQQ